MSVERRNLAACTGCGTCAEICPMDVFRLNREVGKSVIAYPECCQSCGQCYLNCASGSLGIGVGVFSYVLTAVRGVSTARGQEV